MARRMMAVRRLRLVLVCVAALPAGAQSFRVQCPPSTITHPAASNDLEPTYKGPTQFGANAHGYVTPTSTTVNGAVKCQQISGGDGYATMGDGTQTFLFSFGPLSGLADIANGLPGTASPSVFNTIYPYPTPLRPGDPATTDGARDVPYSNGLPLFTWNGAVGLVGDPDVQVAGPGGGATAVATVDASQIVTGATVTNGGSGYAGPPTVTFVCPQNVACLAPGGNAALGTTTVANGKVIAVTITFAGSGYVSAPLVVFGPPSNACVTGTPPLPANCLSGHVDPRQIMDVGVMNGNIPAPLIAFDEDDEFFLTLTNVGMIMRPDLFEEHTVHFHGYPNASSFYDGVPDASVAVNIGGSFTYYYLSPDAGTYFWHCHITPPEHLQMGMVGQLYVRPRQNRVPAGQSLYTYLGYQNGIGLPTGISPDLRTVCNPSADILCSANMPDINTGAIRPAAGTLCSGAASPSGYPGQPKFVYNDGDGSTCYDVEYPLQIHGFDPNFHFVGMTFNPEAFADMKDKYFLLNGRSYPDTVTPGPMATQSSDGSMHYSQPLPSIINIPAGGKALLRIADLDVTEYQTLASLGIRMHVVGFNAKLLRDQAGNNLGYYTNSITLGGGESLDVILDTSSDLSCGGISGCAHSLFTSGSVFYLYTPNLDHMSNGAENFGGLMTEVRIQ